VKIAVVTNYALDGQQSMLRFGELLQRELAARGHEVASLAPAPLSSQRWIAKLAGEKWAGYAAKYLSFPSELRDALHGGRLADAEVIHVVDHSNALYIPARRDRPWVATCHDLLAVRGALGEDTDCPASWLGRRLQHAIVRGLARADAIACDSTSTLQDAARLVPHSSTQQRRTISLGLNQPLRPVAATIARAQIATLDARLARGEYLLHVGSNLARKNKGGVLRVFARLRAEGWRGMLVFCGAPLTPDLRAQAAAAGVIDAVLAFPRASETELAALYSAAHALVFPSKCEGFGWPVLEAQVCGCPVICSDRTSLPEVGGNAALVFDLADEAGMAAAALRLTQPVERAAVVARGFANAAQFSVERMVDAYVQLYEEVISLRRAR
jgi:glycosyltransferase involved in cell wall biosynthesis